MFSGARGMELRPRSPCQRLVERVAHLLFLKIQLDHRPAHMRWRSRIPKKLGRLSGLVNHEQTTVTWRKSTNTELRKVPSRILSETIPKKKTPRTGESLRTFVAAV